MLGRAVLGSRTWMCTIAAPALAASIAEAAICSGATGTAGFFPTESADPVTAQEIITLRCIGRSPVVRNDTFVSPDLTAPPRIRIRIPSVSGTPPCTPLCAALSLAHPSLERIRTKNQGRSTVRRRSDRGGGAGRGGVAGSQARERG